MNNHSELSGIAVALVLCCAGWALAQPQQAEAGSLQNGGQTKPPFAIVISAAKEFGPGAAWIKVELTNNSDHDLEMSGSWSDLTGLNPNYVFDVRDASGKPAPKRVYEHPELVTGKPFNETVGPGEIYSLIQDICRLYDMTIPGDYIVQVSRRALDNSADGYIKSNALTVTVTEQPTRAPISLSRRTCLGPDLEGKSGKDLVQFLKGDRSKLSADCISYAIEQLGNQRYAPAAEVLIAYMDFIPPREGVLVPRAPVIPAENSLVQIGKPAVPALIEAIKNPATPDRIRDHAAELVIRNYVDALPEGLAALDQAAHTTPDMAT